MASEQVFETTELLELILLRLPFTDLLLSQSVCKSWREAIKTSPQLQKALFLLPAIPNQTAIFRDDIGSPSANDVITSSSKWRVPDRYGTNYHFLCPSEQVRKLLYRPTLNSDKDPSPENLGPFRQTAVFLHPLLLSHFPWSRWLFETATNDTNRDPNSDSDSDDETNNIYTNRSEALRSTNPFRYTPTSRPGMHRPEASWRNMLITQPPLGGLSTTVFPGGPGSRTAGAYSVFLGWKPLQGVDVRFAMLYGFAAEGGVSIGRLSKFLDGYCNRVFEVNGKENFLGWGSGVDLERVYASVCERGEVVVDEGDDAEETARDRGESGVQEILGAMALDEPGQG